MENKSANKITLQKENSGKEVIIDYLFLDLNTCDRCIGTDAILEEVINDLSPAFALAGYHISYHKTEIATKQDAVLHHFVSSPTIRVNGCDICTGVIESDCGCCGEISGTQVDCRVFEHGGNLYTVPPKEMIAEAILKNAFSSKKCCCSETYSLPQNLENFFDGKEKKQSCCGNSNC